MTLLWMVYALMIGGIACFASAAAEHLLWIWRGPRRIAWLAALVVGVAAPFLIPAWRDVPHRPQLVTSTTAPQVQSRTPIAASAVETNAGTMQPERAWFTTASGARRWRELMDVALPTIWFAASALLLLFALISYARLERQSAAWREMEIEGTRVVVSENCGPGVFGIWRPRIVVPRWALSIDTRARALMLHHEREHLRAHDAQCLLVATAIALLFPWNAALWLVVRRLRLAVELDCDDRVLRERGDPRTYGSLLLAVCARRAREMPFALALAERSSMLERRIRAMTTVVPRRPLLRSIPLLVAVTVLSVAAARMPSPQAPALPRLSARQLPRLTTAESLPRISANWENAPVEGVIQAFAAFSHHRITTAPGVGGLVTATVDNESWPEALASIMARLGLRVQFEADSSIHISPVAEAQPRSPRSSGSRDAASLVTVHGAPCESLPTNVFPDTAVRSEVPLDTLRALGRRLYPSAYSAGLRDSGVTIALLFDSRCQLQDHVMGQRSTDSLTVDAALTLLMPSIRPHRFRSGGIMELGDGRPRSPWLVWAVRGTGVGRSISDMENRGLHSEGLQADSKQSANALQREAKFDCARLSADTGLTTARRDSLTGWCRRQPHYSIRIF